MTFESAIQTLRSGGDWPDLAEAIAVVISSPEGSLEDLMLGLEYSGVVAEQATLALYRRTGRPLPADRTQLVTDPREWKIMIDQCQGHPAASR